MKIFFIIALAIVCFGLICLCLKRFKVDALYTFAIGGAVNANFFNIATYPIVIGGITFGIDSIIYTVFVFCVFLAWYYFGESKCWAVVWSAVAAIGFSAVMQFVASWSSVGIGASVTATFGSFVASILATIFACWICIVVMKALKRKNMNKYLILIISIFIASIINSAVYFLGMFIINGTLGANFGIVLLASYIGKMIALGFSIVAFWLIERYNKPETEVEYGNRTKTEN